MANEKRTIQSFFAPVAKAKPVAEAPAAANEASAKEVEAKTKEAPGSSSLSPMRSASAQSRTSRWPCSKVLQRKAMEVAAEAAAKGEPPNLDDLLVEETWRGALDGEFGKEYWSSLKKFLAKEYGSGAKVFPRRVTSSARSTRARWSASRLSSWVRIRTTTTVRPWA